MKKIIAFVLAVVMVMSMSVTAFAAELNDGGKNVTANYQAGLDSGKIYKVDVTWGSMLFTYTSAAKGTWNPETHNYDNAEAAKWTCEEGANQITVTNHSNAAVTVGLAYNKAENYSGITGTFNNATLNLASAEGTSVNEAPSASALLTLSGDLSETNTTVTIGSVTVTLNK